MLVYAAAMIFRLWVSLVNNVKPAETYSAKTVLSCPVLSSQSHPSNATQTDSCQAMYTDTYTISYNIKPIPSTTPKVIIIIGPNPHPTGSTIRAGAAARLVGFGVPVAV
jgi:hypothetical protein